MKTVDSKNNTLIVRFGGDDFKSGLDFVKKLVGASFVMKLKYWTVPPLPENIKKLKEDNWVFTATAEALFSNKQKKEVKIDEKKLEGLKPFQKLAVKFVEERDGYAIIGDDCGTGKTIEAIGIAKLHLHEGSFVIVCTASMKLKWAREIKKWTFEDAYIIYGEKESKLPNAKFYIINYHILGKENEEDKKIELERKDKLIKEGKKYRAKPISTYGWWKELIKKNIIGIFLDEAHRLANKKAIWTRSFNEMVCKSNPKILVPLSGTIMRKRPSSLFNILNLIDPVLFSNEYLYLHKYCDPKYTNFGWKFDGATNQEELHGLLNKVMIRRLKSEVLPELPEKEIIPIPLELDTLEAKNYRDADNDFLQFLGKSVLNKKIIKRHISTLKQLAYMAKRNSVFNWIDEFLEDHNKLVIFTWHKIPIADLWNRYKNIAVKVDGSVTAQKRQDAEDRFQEDKKIKLFLGQIDAGGEGLTLTSSDSVAIVEYPDTPGQITQISDRVHRYGQKADHVSIYCLFANGTVENRIIDSLEESFKWTKAILDGEKVDSMFSGDFDDLIANSYRNKNENKEIKYRP